MSLVSSCSEWFNDLLCCDEDEIWTSNKIDCLSVIDFPDDIDELIAGCIEEEGYYMPGFDYADMFQSALFDASARTDSISWILKVYEFYHFQPLTAYLSVNYMDRFLSSGCLPSLPQSKGWLFQLISVACLSLAAKMEEPLVPSLYDIQIEGTKFIFEPRTIRRMELLVLSALDWRLRSVTPFNFIHFFANKIDSTGSVMRSLVSRATEVVLIITRDINFIDYRPSSIAAAAILFAANEIPNLSMTNPANAATWCIGLSKEKIVSCYNLLQEIVVDNCPRTPTKEVPPPLRATRSASELSASSLSSSSSNKRRKLNNSLWVDEEKDI